MPALCAKCHREAPCVSVDGLHCAGWQVGGPFNLMGWKCPVCLGDELYSLMEKKTMHYRNGREAKNGDKVISLAGYGSGPVNINAVGILYDAVPGSDYCNGSIASTIGGPVVGACLCDCLHMDDLAELLKQAGLDKRPEGK